MADIHWRNTQRPARFWIFDARSFVAILLVLVHARVWTFALASLVIAVFWLLERKGLTFESSIRALRAWFWGRHRPANNRIARRYRIDYGE